MQHDACRVRHDEGMRMLEKMKAILVIMALFTGIILAIVFPILYIKLYNYKVTKYNESAKQYNEASSKSDIECSTTACDVMGMNAPTHTPVIIQEPVKEVCKEGTPCFYGLISVRKPLDKEYVLNLVRADQLVVGHDENGATTASHKTIGHQGNTEYYISLEQTHLWGPKWVHTTILLDKEDDLNGYFHMSVLSTPQFVKGEWYDLKDSKNVLWFRKEVQKDPACVRTPKICWDFRDGTAEREEEYYDCSKGCEMVYQYDVIFQVIVLADVLEARNVMEIIFVFIQCFGWFATFVILAMVWNNNRIGERLVQQLQSFGKETHELHTDLRLSLCVAKLRLIPTDDEKKKESSSPIVTNTDNNNNSEEVPNHYIRLVILLADALELKYDMATKGEVIVGGPRSFGERCEDVHKYLTSTRKGGMRVVQSDNVNDINGCHMAVCMKITNLLDPSSN